MLAQQILAKQVSGKIHLFFQTPVFMIVALLKLWHQLSWARVKRTFSQKFGVKLHGSHMFYLC